MYSSQLDQAAQIIRQGGVVAYPTESCYGLGCHPDNHQAIKKLINIKGRPQHKGFILIGATFHQLQFYVADISQEILASWPGPHTWLLPPTKRVHAKLVGQHPRIAVRVTALPIAAALCRAADTALISTSANKSGQQPTKNYRDTMRLFGNLVDMVLPGKIGDRKKPTPIIDAITHDVIRAG